MGNNTWEIHGDLRKLLLRCHPLRYPPHRMITTRYLPPEESSALVKVKTGEILDIFRINVTIDLEFSLETM